jgi:hypothetical protein
MAEAESGALESVVRDAKVGEAARTIRGMCMRFRSPERGIEL